METIITIPRAVFCSARGVAAYPFRLVRILPKEPEQASPAARLLADLPHPRFIAAKLHKALFPGYRESPARHSYDMYKPLGQDLGTGCQRLGCCAPSVYLRGLQCRMANTR